MVIPFNELEDTSKVWIYQSNRAFTPIEEEEITQLVDNFLTTWTAHDTPIRVGFEIKYHRFVIIAADDNQYVSGCSIDNLMRFVQELQKKYNIDLLDKMNVSYRNSLGEINYLPLTDFKKQVSKKEIGASTIVFNNLVSNIYEYQQFWEVPLTESWHSRFLK